MTPNETQFAKIIERISQREIVLDVGGGTPFKGSLLPYKELFKNSFFISIDSSKSCEPTVFGDCLNLPIKSGSVDAVICHGVIQLVCDPFKAVAEIYRVLKPGGIIYIHGPFLYPYHPGKDYDDYFRFTNAGMKLLLKSFSDINVIPYQGYFATLSGLLPMPFSRLGLFPAAVLDKILPVRNQRSGWYVTATK